MDRASNWAETVSSAEEVGEGMTCEEGKKKGKGGGMVGEGNGGSGGELVIGPRLTCGSSTFCGLYLGYDLTMVRDRGVFIRLVLVFAPTDLVRICEM